MKQRISFQGSMKHYVIAMWACFLFFVGFHGSFGGFFPTIAPAPGISQITPVSFLVSWPLYPGFDETTHYQVRLDGALYGSSTKGTSQSVIALRPGYTYPLDYVIYHRGVVVGYSSATRVLMCPEAPTGLFASEITSSSFRLTWGDVPTAEEYLIQIDGYPDRTVSAPSWQVVLDGFLPGVLLNVRMRARNASGYSYDAKTLLVQLLPPAPIQLVVSEIGQTTFRLTWKPSTGAATYTVFRDAAPLVDLASDGLTYLVASCSAGATHTARLQARNLNGASELSEEKRILMLPATPLKPDVTAVSSQSFTIAWVPIAWASGYKIWRDGVWQIGNVSWLTTSATFSKGFDPGNAASITVSAYNSTGDSPQSPAAYVVLADPPPETPASWTLWQLPIGADPEKWSPGTDLGGMTLLGSTAASREVYELESRPNALVVWNTADKKQHSESSKVFSNLYKEFAGTSVKIVAACTHLKVTPRLFLVGSEGRILGTHALLSASTAREVIIQVFGRYLPLGRFAPILLKEQQRFEGIHQPEGDLR